MADAAISPAKQRRRIALLRLTVLMALPAIVFTRPMLAGPELLKDFIESVGILMIIAGVLGRLWAILYIGGRKNAEVMRHGPYSICRHPLYLFSTLSVAGSG